MNPIAKREYGYGSGGPGALLRQTTYTYLHSGNQNYTSRNIVDRVATTTVTDGAGHQLSQTINEYDNYSRPNQTMAASNAIQHDANYGTGFTFRGNVTAVSRWRNTDGTLLTTTNQYDDAGNLVSGIDPLGNKTSFDYSDQWANATCAPAGQGKAYLTTITNAANQITRHTYDSCTGIIASTVDPNSQTTSFSVDLMGRLTQTSYPDGGLTQYCYTDLGGSGCTQSGPPYQAIVTKAITPSQNEISTLVYDGLGRLSQTQLNSDVPSATYTQTTYDGLGRVFQVYNPTRCNPPTTNCGETSWGYTTTNYDSLNRVTSVVEQDGSTINTSYTAFPCTTVTDEAGKSRKSCVDALGRITGVWEDPSNLNYETDYAYDALGNLLTVTQKGGTTNSSQWRVRTFTYDSLSRLVCAANPEIKNVTCPSSPAGPFPFGAITYTYDNNSNLYTKVAPSPNQPSTGTAMVTTTYSYDALNRLTGKSYADSYASNPATAPVQYGYDGVALNGCTTSPPADTDSYPVGRRTSMCDGSGAVSWTHEKLGRILQEARTLMKISGKHETDAYNLDGSVASASALGYGLTYKYNGAGRAISVKNSTDPFNYVTSATYAPSGGLTNATMGAAPITVTNAYNNRLQPLLISASAASSIISLCYDFHMVNVPNQNTACSLVAGSGDNGNVFQIANQRDSNRTQNFLYDSLNRISQAYTSGPNWGETFGPTATNPGVQPTSPGIDAWGNLSNRSGVNGKNVTELLSLGITTQNQLTGFGYDPAGNMTSNGTANYFYDAENRLIWTNAGMSYVYDGDGKRVEKCTAGATPGICPTGATGTLYWTGPGSDPLVETDLAGNTLENYIFFNGQRIARREPGTTPTIHFYFSDHLGSHGVVTNDTGSICEQDIDYYPYGGAENDYCGTVPQHYKFTGKERDSESGLDNFGARYHSSSLGRFLTPDKPFADQHRGNPQSWSLYSYTRNNPLRFVDDNGEEVKESSNTVYYQVSGSTAAEAWNNALAASAISGGYRGNTETNIGVGDYQFDYSSQSKGSTTTVTDTLTSADVNLSVTTTLPTWDGYSSAPGTEQKQWDQLAGGLSDHENGHKAIAEQGANALDKSLPGTKSTGTGSNLSDARKNADTALGQQVEEKHQDAVNTTQNNQNDYDKRTDHGAKPDPQRKQD